MCGDYDGDTAKKAADLSEKDISCELWREYEFAGRPTAYRIDFPKTLVTRVGGTTHRVVDHKGVVHCLPAPGTCGCVLRWAAKEGSPPVKF